MLLYCGENVGTPIKQYAICNKSSAVAEMGDSLATIDMGRKLGSTVPHFFWGGGQELDTQNDTCVGHPCLQSVNTACEHR